MKTSRPKPPPSPDITVGLYSYVDNWCHEPPIKTRCKHGPYECDACGTSDKTDRLHSTVGGRGAVARLGGVRR